MLMPPFTLHHPSTIDEAAVNIASTLINNQEEFDWVAGGTDVYRITSGELTRSHMLSH